MTDQSARVVMIHAVRESIPGVKLAFEDLFPEAGMINLLDEGLFIDFDVQQWFRPRRATRKAIC